MIRYLHLIFAVLVATIFQSCAYKTSFVSSTASNPIIKKGRQTFHLNRFARHAVIYEGSGNNGDLFRVAVGDSIRFENDTLFTLYGSEEYKTRIDSFIYPDERTVVINKQVWQPIAYTKLYRIKSKRQPLSRITAVLCTVSYAAFLTGLIVASASKNESVANRWGAIAVSGDLGVLVLWPINAWIAKKHFVFKKYRVGQRHKPWVMM